MGFYITKLPNGEQLPLLGKEKKIFEKIDGSTFISTPKEWEEGIVCVVVNGMGGEFDAACYADSPQRLEHMKANLNGRFATWMLVPNAKNIAK